MGLFTRATAPRQGRKPGSTNKPMTPTERAQAQYLRELKKTNPERWVEVVETQMGLRAKESEPVDPLEQMVATITKLKAAGLINLRGESDGTRAPRTAKGNDNMWSAVTAALANPTAVPEAIAGVVQVSQRMNGQEQPYAPDTVHLDPAAYRALLVRAGIDPETGHPVTAPTALAAHVPAEAPPAPAPMLPTVPRDGESLGAFIVRVIEGLPPEQAAEWLWALGAKSPDVGDALNQIVRLPDYGLGLAYSRMSGMAGFGELGQWCRDHPDRAMDVIHAMQRVASAA